MTDPRCARQAITIGRLGMVAPQLTAPHLAAFARPWCIALRSIRDDIEKKHAFIGLCNMVKLNPQAPIACLLNLYDAIASWAQPPPPLDEMFTQIVVGYKQSIPPEQWAAFHASWPPFLAQRLAERYGLGAT